MFKAKLGFTINHRMIAGFKGELLGNIRRHAKMIKNDSAQSEHQKVDIALQQIVTYINRFVEFNLVLDTRPATIADAQVSFVLDKGRTLHVDSDETTHIFFRDGVLFIVDAGNPVAPEFMNRIANDNRARDVCILSTHLHNDHKAFYRQLIESALKANKNVTLYLPSNPLQALGGFSSRWSADAFNEITEKGLIRRFLSDPEKGDETRIEIGSSSFRMHVPQKDLDHYIYNRGYTVVSGAQMSAFSGDYNNQFGDDLQKVKDALVVYMEQLLEPGVSNPTITEIQLFLDMGHFGAMGPDNDKALQLFVREHIYELNTVHNNRIKVYLDHQKNSEGYRVVVD